MSFTEDLANKVRAGYALFYITAREEWRAAAEIAKLASERKWQCAVWSVTAGWRQAQDAYTRVGAQWFCDSCRIVI